MGDFNQWNEAATPMVRDAFGTWEARREGDARLGDENVVFVG